MEQALGKVKECEAFGYEKETVLSRCRILLHVLKEQCSNREQAEEKEILACMAEISDFCRNHLETSRTEYSRQYALKREWICLNRSERIIRMRWRGAEEWNGASPAIPSGF